MGEGRVDRRTMGCRLNAHSKKERSLQTECWYLTVRSSQSLTVEKVKFQNSVKKFQVNSRMRKFAEPHPRTQTVRNGLKKKPMQCYLGWMVRSTQRIIRRGSELELLHSSEHVPQPYSVVSAQCHEFLKNKRREKENKMRRDKINRIQYDKIRWDEIR